MRTKLIINNSFVETVNFIDAINPYSNDVIGQIAAASTAEVDQAYESAKNAFWGWSHTPAHERMYKLEQIAYKLLEKKNEIAAMLCAEIAKPMKDALKEVERSAEYILFTAQTYRLLEGRVLDGDKMPGYSYGQKTAIVKQEPLGVVLAISPFNYPINLSVTKIAPALVAGNTIVFKPATAGAISAFMMGDIFAAGLPEGVFNMVSGKASEIGDYLITHENASMIAFTGSTSVGRKIQKLSKVPVYLELGGKDAAVILDDADLKKAASEVTKGGFSYSAQRCTAVKRVVIQDNIADEFIALLLDQVSSLKIGDAKDNADITALIDSKSCDYVMSLIEDAKLKGCKLLVGGTHEGNIVHPTVLDNVTNGMRVYLEEPFGPVLPIIRVQDLEEAISVVNSSPYGLESDVFTQDINKAMYVANRLEVGTVQINGKSDRGPDNFPFPGIKDSGLGVAGLRDAILSMTRTKVIVINT